MKNQNQNLNQNLIEAQKNLSDAFLHSTRIDANHKKEIKMRESLFLLNKDERKLIKNESKALKNINNSLDAIYSQSDKTLEKRIVINGWDFKVFTTNALKFTKGNFDAILETFDDDEQKMFLQRVMLDKVTTQSVTSTMLGCKVASPLAIIKEWLDIVLTEYQAKLDRQKLEEKMKEEESK